ncbi:hypothetical protein RF11_14215 [Thelohanellus kitauei]|uniref:Alpha-soluble NSF attachment protein n=1 Tax=Thelohanellus kitauei TaxID=669202 RepID=A0A0C2ILM0_THEKT|nr:hypothetical protein RF11_14215 [Thelohanellus kitauei]
MNLSCTYGYFSRFLITNDLVVDKYFAHLKNAELYSNAGFTSDAGDAFSRAAEYAEFKLIDYNRAAHDYLDAAICYLSSSQERAWKFFNKSIDALANSVTI